MAENSRFHIKRKDIMVDDVVVEGDSLTIGRLTGNDLVLNHRSVSRTHAGIKEFHGEFWLFNLSNSNGTVLNGELVDKTPLADGDVIQIGRYMLQIKYLGTVLSITVEMEIEAHVVEARPISPGVDESSAATALLQRVVLPGKQTVAPGGTKRLQGTGLLTTALPGLDEHALEVFWDKRKREAGKIGQKSRLQPSGDHRVGKAQFNWRPSLDLTRPWRKSYFVWGALIVALLSGGALFAYTQAYSPGAIASVHTSGQMSNRGIAVRTNGGSCSECHSPTVSIQNKCTDCHTTQTFHPTISDAHTRAGLACVSCHGEHMGASFRPGRVGTSMCISCHNNTYQYKGKVLGTPHGGTVGYPVVDLKWQWTGIPETEWRRLELPDTASKYTPVQQFHLIHVGGKEEGRSNCTDCHSAGLNTDEGLRTSPRAACAACHSVSFDSGGKIVGPNCTTCHEQHGEARNLVASLRDPEEGAVVLSTDATTRNVPVLGWGGAQVIRHDEHAGARWNFARTGYVGGLPWYAWTGIIVALPLFGLAVMAVGSVRRRLAVRSIKVEPSRQPERAVPGTRLLDIKKLEAEGPPYPHPVVDPLLCIGCHACVEACPHDVLAIVNGVSTPVALDQCMEDTGCTVECPTSPKACIVINTKKVIPPRKVPSRNQRLMSNVEGIYIVGDVSGVPLIKNALNEGAQVIDYVVEDLKAKGTNPAAEYDVAIIGVGPAGLSATAIAKQRGLKYVAIEQDQVVSTIQNYPAGKYVFFKPDSVEAKGLLPLAGAGNKKETILESWVNSMTQNGLEIQEEESCKDIKKQDGHFVVITEAGKLKERSEYKTRAVILAIGNRGTPMKLRVPGEEIKKIVQPGPVIARHCPRCGTARKGKQLFCVKCGQKLPVRTPGPMEDMKVKYKLADPDDYSGKKCIVVGAGNSAIEAAVDLTGFKRDGDKISFTRDNEVTLVVRSDFKGDLKLGNKMNVYDCMDAGRIKVFFRTEIKEITPNEALLMDTRSKEERARLANDYIFALIGGDRPTKFLESIGIKIG
jgi:thioredoxin reductase (NADPH)